MCVCVCGGCGRTIDNDYIYCPWCGQTKSKSNSNHNFDEVFKRLEKKQAAEKIEQLKNMEMKLDALEKDLSVLVLSAEMAK